MPCQASRAPPVLGGHVVPQGHPKPQPGEQPGGMEHSWGTEHPPEPCASSGRGCRQQQGSPPGARLLPWRLQPAGRCWLRSPGNRPSAPRTSPCLAPPGRQRRCGRAERGWSIPLPPPPPSHRDSRTLPSSPRSGDDGTYTMTVAPQPTALEAEMRPSVQREFLA